MAPAGGRGPGAFAAELQRSGLARLPCSVAALEELAELFAKLPTARMFAEKAGAVYSAEGPRGRASFVVAPTAVTDHMRWFWACDEAAMAPFDALGDACVEALEAAAERPLLLCSACFVVVRGTRIAAAEVKQHADWAHRRIPAGASFTCLAPLSPLPRSVGGLRVWPWDGPERECRYEYGGCIAIDGKLFHRTEPFQYQRDGAEAGVCDTYEASGHLRVLVSLSIASFDERLAGYSRKVMRHMTPRAALVREAPEVFLDSESEFLTSDTDSDAASCASSASSAASRFSVQGETVGVRSLRTILQGGLWRGARHASHSWEGARPLELELGFDLASSEVVSRGQVVGSFKEDLGMWHVTLELHDDAGGDLIFTGEFVRGPASVCLQGRYRDSGWGGYLCLFPPRPWHVLSETWRLFPLPNKAIGLPAEPGVVELSWTDDAGAEAAAVGREARSAAGGGAGAAAPGPAEAGWRQLGRAVFLQDGVPAPGSLEPGCAAVVPDVAQRLGTFERLLAAAAAAGCSAVVVLQGGRPQLPRAARCRGPTPPLPVLTVGLPAAEDRGPELPGSRLAVRPAPPGAVHSAGWAERLGVVEI